jgi:hypothetical protein
MKHGLNTDNGIRRFCGLAQISFKPVQPVRIGGIGGENVFSSVFNPCFIRG